MEDEEPADAEAKRKASQKKKPEAASVTPGRTALAEAKMHEYLEEDQLEDLQDPPGALAKAVVNLTCGNWRDEFAAMDDIRALVTFHKELLEPELAAITRQLTEQLQNLRSSIVKNATLCFRALFVRMGPDMDKFLDKLGPVLLRKAADPNKFVAAEGMTTMQAVVDHASAKKCMRFIIPLTLDKAKAIRSVATLFLLETVKKSGKEVFDANGGSVLGELVNALAPLLYAATTDCRALAKDAVFILGQLANAEGGKTKKEFEQTCARKVESKYRERFDAALVPPKKKVAKVDGAKADAVSPKSESPKA